MARQFYSIKIALKDGPQFAICETRTLGGAKAVLELLSKSKIHEVFMLIFPKREIPDDLLKSAEWLIVSCPFDNPTKETIIDRYKPNYL